jgi:hypothetical protein
MRKSELKEDGLYICCESLRNFEASPRLLVKMAPKDLQPEGERSVLLTVVKNPAGSSKPGDSFKAASSQVTSPFYGTEQEFTFDLAKKVEKERKTREERFESDLSAIKEVYLEDPDLFRNLLNLSE